MIRMKAVRSVFATQNGFGSGWAHFNITGPRGERLKYFLAFSLTNVKAFVSFLTYLPSPVYLALTEVFAGWPTQKTILC